LVQICSARELIEVLWLDFATSDGARATFQLEGSDGVNIPASVQATLRRLQSAERRPAARARRPVLGAVAARGARP
jgi:hypothetical protein